MKKALILGFLIYANISCLMFCGCDAFANFNGEVPAYESLEDFIDVEVWGDNDANKSDYYSHDTLNPIVSKDKTHLYSPEITPEIWMEVSPYLMRDNHPVKKNLDYIFAKSRVLESEESLQNAGFKIIFKQLSSGLIVAKHPWLEGYLVKLYLDSSHRQEWPLWVLRAHGAEVIRKIIAKHSYQQYMKVPRKWIYPIPKEWRPSSNENTFPKDFILVVTDMRLASSEVSVRRFKGGLGKMRLKALYTVITEGGLSDSHIGNIPFSRDGKTAFIDTEYVHNWPVHLEWLTESFSPKNQHYWQWLIDHGTKSNFR